MRSLPSAAAVSDGDAVSFVLSPQVALCVLEDLASANNLCREAIVLHAGVPVLLQAAESCSARARRAVAGRCRYPMRLTFDSQIVLVALLSYLQGMKKCVESPVAVPSPPATPNFFVEIQYLQA